MGERVRLSEDEFREIYQTSYTMWLGLFSIATRYPSLPTHHLSAEHAFPFHPIFPRGLLLGPNFYTFNNRRYAICFAQWGLMSPENNPCPHQPPIFDLPTVFAIGTRNPVSARLAISEEPDRFSD
jgi:hypothetical protein